MFKRFKTRRTSRTKISWRTFPKEMGTHEFQNEIDQIKNLGEKIKRKDLKCKTNK